MLCTQLRVNDKAKLKFRCPKLGFKAYGLSYNCAEKLCLACQEPPSARASRRLAEGQQPPADAEFVGEEAATTAGGDQ